MNPKIPDKVRVGHWIAHLFGWNTGRVYTWWDSDTGELMVGFRCDGCNCILGVHVSPTEERSR